MKDELLYSAILRYHKESGNELFKDTCIDLFGKNKRSISADLPNDLYLLSENISHLFKDICTEELLMKHTLYNYYTNFIKGAVKEKIRARILKNKGNNILHYSTGQNAGIVKEPVYFRYCYICMEEDLLSHGFTYWRTYQQLPSVFTCKDHLTPLKESSHLIRKSYETNRIITKLNKENKDIVNFSKVRKESLYLITNESYKLSICDYKFCDLHLDSVYRKLLEKKGYINLKGTVKQEKLRGDFIAHYHSDFLELMQSIPNGQEGSCWLKSISRKHRKSFHPIRHLLFINFLGESVETIYKDYKVKSISESPFGSGPYPCLNAAANHYQKTVVTDVIVTRCSKTKLPVGTFKCSCGFIYSRRGPDKTQGDKTRIGRIKEFGDVWRNELYKLINIDKLSYREASKKLKVDIKTVIKYSEPISITNKRIEKHQSEDLKGQWLSLHQENPLLSVTELRRLYPSLYARLYRADKNWLSSISHGVRINPQSIERVDWSKRDRELVEEIKVAVGKLYSMDRPVRITKSLIGKVTRKRDLIEKKSWKIPLAMDYIFQVSETIEEFQKRRILWVIQKSSPEDLKVWKVLRKAGLTKRYYPEVEILINNFVEKT